MIRLALAGGLMSGKSTLARYLVNEHGFHYINYTDIIKTFAAEALRSIGIEVSVADIHADKERYRAFLIALATLLDFDHGFGIDEIVASLTPEHDRVVFDCVRFGAQFAKLRAAGFRLVRVETPFDTRWERAEAAGMSYVDFQRRLNDPTEQPLPHVEGEIKLVVDGPMDAVCNRLTGLLLRAEQRERADARRAVLVDPEDARGIA